MSVCVPGNVLEELLQLLKLEKIEENIFRGQSQDLGFGNVFGGQVLGQALSAASQTVPSERHAHSLHGYFMHPGNVQKPIVYTVDCIRDGKNFTTRRVVAVQGGRAIFSMSASFQMEESGFEHQDRMPDVPGPEELKSVIEFARPMADKLRPDAREKLLREKPIESRIVDPINPFEPEKRPPEKYIWLRAIDNLPDDPFIHQCLLAYASDFGLVGTALNPHGQSFWMPGMQLASLDHAMWFHGDFRLDDWLLFSIRSPRAAKSRGLAIGHFFTHDGRLVATAVQEGLIRKRKGQAGA